MLRVSCKDIGIDGCDFVAEGEKVRKVENAMLNHLLDAHPYVVSGLTDAQHRDLEMRIKSGMHGLPPEAQAHEPDKHLLLCISCSDMGIAGCDFVAQERKVRKVEERFFDHLRDVHPDVITGLTGDQHRELEHAVKEAIRHE